MSSIAELQAEIAAWIDPLHPERAPLGIVAKMLAELAELIASERMSDPLELADVFILALDLATIQGVDVAAAVRLKLEINRQRTWSIADNGVMQHVD
jgi:hypothetical protein